MTQGTPAMVSPEPAVTRHRQSPPVSLGEYARRIHDLRKILDSVAPGHAHMLRAATRQMEALGRVQVRDGSEVTTPLPEWGRALMSGRPSEIQSIRGRVDSLDSAFHALRPHRWGLNQLHQLDNLLRDARFHPHLNPVQAAEGWLGDRVSQLLWFLAHRISLSGTNRYPILNAVVAIIFLLLVAGVAVLIARAAIGRSAASVPRGKTQAEVSNPMTARQRANDMAAAGSYREAFRYLFLATLLELREAGLIQLRPGDTNREYVISLHEGSHTIQQREALDNLVDEFDRVWYGHQPLTRAEYERCAALAASVTEPGSEGLTA